MNQEEYLAYRKEIDKAEQRRMFEEAAVTPLNFLSSINLTENTENLGYSRHFMTREDAEFLMEKILQWEKDNSYLEEIDDHISRDLELEIDTYMTTGVKFEFKCSTLAYIASMDLNK